MTLPASVPLLEVRQLGKRFPGVRALHGVDLTLQRGEILAVIGENGAGKSTLMKILAGILPPDQGEILLHGRPVQLGSVRAAEEAGVVLIHQELNLADNLTVAANVFLGREPHRWGLIRSREMDCRTAALMAQVGLDVSPREPVCRLSPGRQQLVEIAKALAVDARIVIMDEPTSSLSQRESDTLFDVIRGLRKRGVSILYISHRLGEVTELADRVLVLRDGQNAGHLQREEIRRDRMVQLMVGREISQFYQRRAHSLGPPVLELRRLRTSAYPREEVSFSVRAGEIAGLAGLVGAGRSELLRVLFGIDKALGGSVWLEGRRLDMRAPSDAIGAGLALVPEDRKEQGLILEMAVRQNLSLASLRRDQRRGFIDRAGEESLARRLIGQLAIRTPSPDQITQYLSGGNQQKIALGKWLALSPKALLLDEPTRGVDVGAKQEIYRLMEELAARGIAVLFVSSEMEEILHMSDRVLVMHEGRLSGELSREHVSEEAVMQLATGSSALQP